MVGRHSTIRSNLELQTDPVELSHISIQHLVVQLFINYKYLLLVKLMRFLIHPRLLQPEIPRHLLVDQGCRPVEINIMITVCEPLDVELLRADFTHSQGVD